MRKQTIFIFYFLLFFLGISSSVLGQEVLINPPDPRYTGNVIEPYVDYTNHEIEIHSAFSNLSDEAQRLYCKFLISYLNYGRFSDAIRGYDMKLVYEVITTMAIDNSNTADLFINDFVSNGIVSSRDEFFRNLENFGYYDQFMFEYTHYIRFERIKLRKGKHIENIQLGDAFDKLPDQLGRYTYYRVVDDYIERGHITTEFIGVDRKDINRVIVAIVKDNPMLEEFLMNELQRMGIARDRTAVFQSMEEYGYYDEFTKALGLNDPLSIRTSYAYNNSGTDLSDQEHTNIDVSHNKSTLHYDLLTDEEKKLYHYLYEGLANASESINIPMLSDSDAIHNASDAVYYDYPEFVWYKGGYWTRWYDTYMIIEPIYNGLSENHAYYQKQFEDAADEIIKMALEKKTPLEQERFVFEYIVSNTVYLKHDLSWSPYAALVMKEAICLGFAQAFLYIMQRLGIPAYGRNDDEHAWVVVNIDGTWYNVNPTTYLKPGNTFMSREKLDSFVERYFNLPIDGYRAKDNNIFPSFRLPF